MPHDWLETNAEKTRLKLWKCSKCKALWAQKDRPSEEQRLNFKFLKNMSCEDIQNVWEVRDIHAS